MHFTQVPVFPASSLKAWSQSTQNSPNAQTAYPPFPPTYPHSVITTTSRKTARIPRFKVDRKYRQFIVPKDLDCFHSHAVNRRGGKSFSSVFVFRIWKRVATYLLVYLRSRQWRLFIFLAVLMQTGNGLAWMPVFSQQSCKFPSFKWRAN